MSQYQQRLYLHIQKMVGVHADADDLLQNTFVKAWKGLPDFRGESGLFTWLYRIATNETLTFLTQKKTRATPHFADPEIRLQHHPAHESPDGEMLVKELHKCLTTLPHKQRLVFQMRYYEEMPYETISEILGTSVGALKASYHHASKKVEEWFTQISDT